MARRKGAGRIEGKAKKPLEHGGRLPVALLVPGGEPLAVSALGWQAVHRMLVGLPGLAVERFHPLKPSEPSLSLEGGRALSSFPVVAASLAFEEDFLHLPRALAAAGVPPRAAERPQFPLVLAGGPCVFMNPAPMSPFVDAFFVGEAEAGLEGFALALRDAWLANTGKAEFLDKTKDLPGIYVPGRSRIPVRRAVFGDSASGLPCPAYSAFTNRKSVFGDALLLEVNRGCPHGCRFCAAGFVYRPPRHASVEDLKAIVERERPRKVGLVGTALTDWPELLPFLTWLRERKISFGLSSLRADGLLPELLAELRASKVRTVTLALEGASERLRRVANKNLDAGVFLDAVRRCARSGVNHLKIYLIVGWPDETEADYAELEAFLARIVRAREEEGAGSGKNLMRITLAASSLVPKPWTPLQWAPMASEQALAQRFRQLKTMVKPFRGVTLAADSPFQARLQGLLARGDESVADLIELAAERGGWKKGLELWPGDAAAFLDRERGRDEPFPWEVVDAGVDRGYLWREWLRGKKALQTPACPQEGCATCRACGMESWLRTGA